MSLADIYGECRECGYDDLINDGLSIECNNCGATIANFEPEENSESDYECDDCNSRRVEVLTTFYECSDCGEQFGVDGDVDEDIEIECSECSSNDTIMVRKELLCKDCGTKFIEHVI